MVFLFAFFFLKDCVVVVSFWDSVAYKFELSMAVILMLVFIVLMLMVVVAGTVGFFLNSLFSELVNLL